MTKSLAILLSAAAISSSIGLISNPAKADQSNPNYSQVIAFGDSYSDNGGAKSVSTAIVNSVDAPSNAYIKPSDDLYWNSRYSNGQTAVEVLAADLGLELTNYAVGGAKSDATNYSAWMDHLGGTGLLGQIEAYAESLRNGEADPDALYFIFASANDYFYNMDYATGARVKDLAEEAVENIGAAIQELVDLGATNFFIVNSSDLTIVPDEIAQKRTASAKAFTKRVNADLPKLVKNMMKENKALSIELFDITEVSDMIMANPSAYGLTNVTDPVQPTWPELKPLQGNADEYYFFDEWHYTAAVHKIIGDSMYEAVID